MADLGGGQRHGADVVARELDLVLDVGRAHVVDAVEELDLAHELVAEEVADLALLPRLVDGEVPNQVIVEKSVQKGAKIALERMLSIKQ